ncbi:MAG: hypothetical protein A2V21_301310 [Deltaproteobacteria bacterium GWC2_55_46]|nr:MAG: hypothetical protein A3I81_08375 [Deltaproteobacteria bacterium RIFCSPLOWO2_02_FULL_55_12]OIJ73014.1 MAG: hypothetical protein A2V21_301310 [Deltaproteobacteria bacterium GWC2_55_46]
MSFFYSYRRSLFVGVLTALFILIATGIALRKSNTWDEPAHILSGYAYLAKGMDYIAPVNHPVLGRAITAAFPWLFLDLSIDETIEPEGAKDSRFIPYSVKFLYENKAGADDILFLSRLGNILLAALLAIYVYIWSSRLWGATGAFLSLFFFILCPNMLANASIATTDLPITAFFFITSYYLFRTAEEGVSTVKTIAASVFFTFALASKHTAFLLIPFIPLAYLFAARKDGARKLVTHLGFFILLSYTALWAVYGFRFHSSAAGYTAPEWGIFPPTGLTPLFAFIRDYRLLPESYLLGVVGSIAGAEIGKPTFFMGEYSSSTGWFSYFPVAFLIKTPIPALILLAASVVYLTQESVKRRRALMLMLPAILVFLVFTLERVNIGLRHILPVYPFLFTLIGFVPSIRTKSEKLARAVFYTCMVWYAYAASLVYPHQLAYFNEFIGGPKNGYRYLVDSNLDWGQDLLGLKEYVGRKGIKKIKLAYFGLSDPAYFGIDYQYMPSYLILKARDYEPDIELKGWFAISATMLQGVYLPDHDFYAVFRNIEPVEKIGYSIFVYRLGVDEGQ